MSKQNKETTKKIIEAPSRMDVEERVLIEATDLTLEDLEMFVNLPSNTVEQLRTAMQDMTTDEVIKLHNQILQHNKKIKKTVFSAIGVCKGKLWGGGIGYYETKAFNENSYDRLEQEILIAIHDDSIDNGMGFEEVLGARMYITTTEIRTIDGKDFKHSEAKLRNFGDINAHDEDTIDQTNDLLIY